jgi:hypothetical protein
MGAVRGQGYDEDRFGLLEFVFSDPFGFFGQMRPLMVVRGTASAFTIAGLPPVALSFASLAVTVQSTTLPHFADTPTPVASVTVTVPLPFSVCDIDAL